MPQPGGGTVRAWLAKTMGEELPDQVMGRHDGYRDDDGEADEGGRRLALAFVLRMLTNETVGPRIAAAVDGAALLRAARALADGFAPVAARYGLHSEPPYPGATPGPQRTSSGWRLLLAARLYGGTGAVLGVAFTSLASGRAPVVSVAPPDTRMDPSWRSP